jgi:hypothetical protein
MRSTKALAARASRVGHPEDWMKWLASSKRDRG